MRSFVEPGSRPPLAAAPLGLAYRFALAYRVRAGYPRRSPPRITPADIGLPYESMLIESDGLPLPAWFIPARDGAPGPGVVLVHGWESARDRTLPMAAFLNAAGFHCLTLDIRGNGANPAEDLPLSAGEFGADALAGVPRAHRAARGDGRRDLRSLDGRHRGDPRGRRRPARRGRRRDLRHRPIRTGSPARRSGSPACPSRTRSPTRSPG